MRSIGYVFHLNDTGETVEQIKVEASDQWMWNALGFDISKVSDPVEVPEAIRYYLNWWRTVYNLYLELG